MSEASADSFEPVCGVAGWLGDAGDLVAAGGCRFQRDALIRFVASIRKGDDRRDAQPQHQVAGLRRTVATAWEVFNASKKDMTH